MEQKFDIDRITAAFEATRAQFAASNGGIEALEKDAAAGAVLEACERLKLWETLAPGIILQIMQGPKMAVANFFAGVTMGFQVCNTYHENLKLESLEK